MISKYTKKVISDRHQCFGEHSKDSGRRVPGWAVLIGCLVRRSCCVESSVPATEVTVHWACHVAGIVRDCVARAQCARGGWWEMRPVWGACSLSLGQWAVAGGFGHWGK